SLLQRDGRGVHLGQQVIEVILLARDGLGERAVGIIRVAARCGAGQSTSGATGLLELLRLLLGLLGQALRAVLQLLSTGLSIRARLIAYLVGGVAPLVGVLVDVVAHSARRGGDVVRGLRGQLAGLLGEVAGVALRGGEHLLLLGLTRQGLLRAPGQARLACRVLASDQ